MGVCSSSQPHGDGTPTDGRVADVSALKANPNPSQSAQFELPSSSPVDSSPPPVIVCSSPTDERKAQRDHIESCLPKSVMISYAHKDAHLAAEVETYLTLAGFQVWIDTKIVPGTDWRSNIAAAIDSSFAVIFIMTPQSIQSKYCKEELYYALQIKRDIFPIVFEKQTYHHLRGGIKMILQRIQWIEVFKEKPSKDKAYMLLAHHLLRAKHQRLKRELVKAGLVEADDRVSKKKTHTHGNNKHTRATSSLHRMIPDLDNQHTHKMQAVITTGNEHQNHTQTQHHKDGRLPQLRELSTNYAAADVFICYDTLNNRDKELCEMVKTFLETAGMSVYVASRHERNNIGKQILSKHTLSALPPASDTSSQLLSPKQTPSPMQSDVVAPDASSTTTSNESTSTDLSQPPSHAPHISCVPPVSTSPEIPAIEKQTKPVRSGAASSLPLPTTTMVGTLPDIPQSPNSNQITAASPTAKSTMTVPLLFTQGHGRLSQSTSHIQTTQPASTQRGSSIHPSSILDQHTTFSETPSNDVSNLSSPRTHIPTAQEATMGTEHAANTAAEVSPAVLTVEHSSESEAPLNAGFEAEMTVENQTDKSPPQDQEQKVEVGTFVDDLFEHNAAKIEAVYLIIFISTALSVKSADCQDEIHHAYELNKPIIQVRSSTLGFPAPASLKGAMGMMLHAAPVVDWDENFLDSKFQEEELLMMQQQENHNNQANSSIDATLVGSSTTTSTNTATTPTLMNQVSAISTTTASTTDILITSNSNAETEMTNTDNMSSTSSSQVALQKKGDKSQIMRHILSDENIYLAAQTVLYYTLKYKLIARKKLDDSTMYNQMNSSNPTKFQEDCLLSQSIKKNVRSLKPQPYRDSHEQKTYLEPTLTRSHDSSPPASHKPADLNALPQALTTSSKRGHDLHVKVSPGATSSRFFSPFTPGSKQIYPSNDDTFEMDEDEKRELDLFMARVEAKVNESPTLVLETEKAIKDRMNLRRATRVPSPEPWNEDELMSNDSGSDSDLRIRRPGNLSLPELGLMAFEQSKQTATQLPPLERAQSFDLGMVKMHVGTDILSPQRYEMQNEHEVKSVRVINRTMFNMSEEEITHLGVKPSSNAIPTVNANADKVSASKESPLQYVSAETENTECDQATGSAKDLPLASVPNSFHVTPELDSSSSSDDSSSFITNTTIPSLGPVPLDKDHMTNDKVSENSSALSVMSPAAHPTLDTHTHDQSPPREQEVETDSEPHLSKVQSPHSSMSHSTGHNPQSESCVAVAAVPEDADTVTAPTVATKTVSSESEVREAASSESESTIAVSS